MYVGILAIIWAFIFGSLLFRAWQEDRYYRFMDLVEESNFLERYYNTINEFICKK